MLFLQAVTPAVLAESVGGITLQEARRIVGAVHRHGQLPHTVRNVRRTSMESARAAGSVPQLRVRETRHSRIDPFVKYTLDTPGGEIIETVRIPLEKAGRFSVCVSSQAGCALGCLFCATGRLGLSRNLETWEMVEQVRIVRRTLDPRRRERVHGLVFQGMGEPLANLTNVVNAIRVMKEPSGMAIDSRAITVCTAGLPAGIRRLAREVPAVRLAISMGSVDPVVRRRLMPISGIHPLERVLEAAAEHARITGLAPMWAITLLEGVNDTAEDAREVARLAGLFARESGRRPRITILTYNPIAPEGGELFTPSGAAREAEYRRILGDAGFPPHRRYSGGADIGAACGQLAGR